MLSLNRFFETMSLRYYRSEVKTKEFILYFTRLIVSLENLSLNRTLTCRSKVLTFGKIKIYLLFLSLNRTFVARYR